MLFNTVRLGETELAIVRRNGLFRQIIGPGGIAGSMSLIGANIRRVDLTGTPVRNDALEALYLTHPVAVREHLTVVEPGESELALVRCRGRLIDTVQPAGRAMYAKALYPVEVEMIDTGETLELPAHLIGPLARLDGLAQGHLVVAGERNQHLPLRERGILLATVPRQHTGLLTVDGATVRTLQPGRYLFVLYGRQVEVALVEQRVATLEVTGQEVLTADRIGVRTNVTVLYRVTDPVLALTVAKDPAETLYKEVQFAVRQAIGKRSLEAVLGDKVGVDEAMTGILTPKAEVAGLELVSAGLKDVILPGDIRELMNRVVEAEKTAMANVIRRREETAATRSLLNTAKLMEDNPVLLRLKELEALERVTGNVGNLIVGQGLDGMLDNLVRIVPREGRA